MCAEKLKKDTYWHYHEGLFSGEITFDKPSYLNAAVDLKLNQKKYAQCLNSQEISALIDNEIAQGSSLGVSGTPAFFVGKVQGNKLVDAKGLLDALFEEGCRPSVRWVRKMQAGRCIPYVKIGHLVRFDVEEVRAALTDSFTVSTR